MQAKNLKSYKHSPHVIPPDVEKHIRPIYKDLSKDDLLIKCLGGNTQNANEYESYCQQYDLAPLPATFAFKKKNLRDCRLYRCMNFQWRARCDFVGYGHTEHKTMADQLDDARLARAGMRYSESTEEARTAQRGAWLTENEFFEDCEELLYRVGVAD